MKLSNAATAPSVYDGSLRDNLGAQFRATIKRQTPLGKF
jgi:hypothetical protein